MDLSDITAFQIFHSVVVFDLASCAVEALQAEDFSLGNTANWRNVGMPAVVKWHRLVLGRSGGVDFYEGFGGGFY